jgi:hypothetical protein
MLTRALLMILLLFAATPVKAKVITIKLEGYLYQVSGAASGSFFLGQTVYAFLQYDAAVTGVIFYPNNPTIRYYASPSASGLVKVGSYSARLSGARMFVTDNEIPFNIDRLTLEDLDPEANTIGGREINNLFFNWQDNSATALSSLDLPDDAATFALLGNPRMAIDWGSPLDGSNRVTAIFTEMSIATVPEPGTWSMLIAGFGLMGIGQRAKRRRDESGSKGRDISLSES